MKIEEFINILKAIKEDKAVNINYKLIANGRLYDMIERGFFGINRAIEFFEDVLNSEPADILEE